jgi:GNAT superfamily N-acetyltransferase
MVRAATHLDTPELEVLHERMSADSLRHRFFGTGSGLAHRYLEHLAHAPETIALVAVAGRRLYGLGTAEPLGGGRAEVAFVVDEHSHGLGIGTLLLEAIAREAGARGIRELVADVMAENHEMLDVFRHAGFEIASHRVGDTVRVTMRTEVTDAQVEAAHRRRLVAEGHVLPGGPAEDGTSDPAQSLGARMDSSS